MIPRGKIDIGWNDLAFGIRASIRGGNRAELEDRLASQAFPGANNLACLSVRSGFDALLTTLHYPAGSEVLVSALTIKHMVQIIEDHGLVPVPVDLDMDTIAIDPSALEGLITERTRAILVAHVFGAEIPLADIARVARRHSLLLIEDRAQVYEGRDEEGSPEADVVMFSFGPIKTNTALGGAILRFRDPALRDRVRSVAAAWPVQRRSVYLKRLVKYAGIKLLSYSLPFALFARACRLFGTTHDSVISHALRGFPGSELMTQIRRQPSFPLLALLDRRLTTFDRRRIQQRKQVAEQLATLLPDVRRPGHASRSHSHWIFPIQHHNPDALMRYLWTQGIDATRGASSLAAVDPPPNRPEAEPAQARSTMADVVYLPAFAGLSTRQLTRLAAQVHAFDHTDPDALSTVQPRSALSTAQNGNSHER